MALSPTFPSGGGEMGARLRGHDWAATPLGPVEGWSPALRLALATCLNTQAVAAVFWGPEFRLLYNDAYAPFLEARHPWALGRPMAEVWPRMWGAVRAQAAQVLATGEGFVAANQHLLLDLGDGAAESVWFYSFAPVMGEDGAVGGVFLTALDTTAQARGEQALRAASRRQGFRLRLEERLRNLADPGEIVAAASEALGQQLGAGQVAYGELDPTGEFTTIADEWSDGRFLPISGRHRLVDYGPALVADLQQGVTIAIDDVRLDGRTATPEALASFARIGLAAFIDVPLVKEGRLVAILAVHDGSPRAWSPDEVTLAKEVAERIWSAAEQARAEATLRRSEARYRTLFEAIDAGFCIVEVRLDDGQGRADYRLVEANPAFYPQTGLPQTIRGQWLREALPGLEEHWYDVYGRVARTGQPVRFEQSSDLVGRWFDVHAFRVDEPPAGTQEGRVAILFTDISERRRAEERLRELNETLESRVAEALAARHVLADIVDSSRAPTVALNLDYTILAINEANVTAFERVYGSRPKAGDNLVDLLAHMPESQAQVKATWGRALAGEEFTVVDTFGDAAHDRVAFEIHFSALRDREGRQVGATHTAFDVSERVRAQAELDLAQEALRQSQKMEAMGSLTGGVAHDFNNLLTPIIGSLDRLVTRGVGSEREQRLMAGALESAERAKTLVQRLLAFARRQPLQPVAVDVGALVTSMTGLIGSTLGPAVELRLDLPPDLPPARADANQLEMALLNLAVNARDAMPGGGTLTVTAARASVRGSSGPGRHRAGLGQGHYLRLTVADTGSGMDAATLARAAEPFFSTKGIGRGTGLGLSMVHGLAAQLGGGLTIDSHPGQGTTVTLWLPLSASPVGEAGPSRAAPAPIASRGRALLVDDEELVRMSTADMLADLGFEVLEAGSAEDALRLLLEGVEVDLLVTDHLMPGMSGADLVRETGRLRPGLPALIVSGYAEVEGIAPDVPRLVKPFRAAELAEHVAAVMSDGGSGT